MPMPDPATGAYVMEMDDMEHWRDFVHFPDVESFDWATHVEADMAGVDCEGKLVNISIGHGMFERLHSLMGMEDGAMALSAYPDEVLDFFNALAEHKCAVIRKLAQYYPKVDLIDMSDDWGHQTAAFFSEDTWNALFRPGMKKIMDTCREVGVMFQLHSCGRWEKVLPHAMEAGLDHWTSSQCVNDIDSILKTYGRRLTMVGGCDVKEIQHPGMTLERMREIVSDRIDKVCRGWLRDSLRQFLHTLLPSGRGNGGCPAGGLLYQAGEPGSPGITLYQEGGFCPLLQNSYRRLQRHGRT